MKRKKIGKILTGSLAVGMLLSQGNPYNVLAQSRLALNVNGIEITDQVTPEQSVAFTKLQKTANGVGIAAQMMNNLSQEQREALMKLQTLEETGLQLSPDVNLESTDEISVIVEFKQRPSKVAIIEAATEGQILSEKEAKEKVNVSHDTFKKDLETIKASKKAKKASSYQVKRTYKSAFNGVSMKLPANEIQLLLQSEEVKAVYSDIKVQVEPPAEAQDTTAENTGKGMADERSYLQVDKLHKEGYTGKGVKVGVIDTGIDYNHPDLEVAFKGGYDFVDNDADPMETTFEDWQAQTSTTKYPEFSSGRAYYTSHGTHVSGTIAGQGTNTSEMRTTGIAPDAELHVYRVLGPYGSGTTEAVLAGIDKAVEDGMDVVNMSLGATLNDPLYATSIAANNAVLSGVTMVISAGNSGDKMYTLGSPGAAALALTVGASDVPMTIANGKGSLPAGADTVSADLRLLALGYEDDIFKLKGQTLPVVYGGMGTATDFTGKDVKGKIALISRGNNIALVDKIKAAKQNGAAAVLLFNNIAAEGHIPAYLAEGADHIPTFSLTNADGLALKQKVDAGYTNFTFGEITESKTKGDELAGFSSRGPSRFNYDIKPEVTAPGVAMLSTVPSDVINRDNGDNYQYAYQRMSGTSMASPTVAGIAALLLQAHPDMKPLDVKATLMNTADALSKPYSVFEVGAGRVDPYEAIHSDVEISTFKDKTTMIANGEKYLINEETGGISYGQIFYSGEDTIKKQSVLLSNNGKTTKTFDVKVQFQVGLRGSLDAEKNGVKVLTDKTIKLSGMNKKKSEVNLLIPNEAEKGNYEGYVVYTNKDNPSETYQVPFGVNYVEKGLEYFSVLGNGMTSTTQSALNPFMVNTAVISCKLKSNVKRIDLLVVEPKTNKTIGYIGNLNGQSLDTDTNYDVLLLGFYSPFVGDQSKPFSIDDEYIRTQFDNVIDFIPHGNYKVRAMLTTDDGKTFAAGEDYLFVDNTGPKYDLNLPHGVYEYEAGQKSVEVSGSIYEENINEMKAAGKDFSQNANKIAIYYNKAKPSPTDWQNTLKGQPSGFIPKEAINPDGTFAANLPIDDSIQILPVRFYGYSPSGAGDYPKMPTTYFVKKGTQYVAATPNKQDVYTGETVTYKLTMNNANKLKEQSFTFDYLGDYFDIASVTVNSVTENKVAVTHKALPGSSTLKKHSIHISAKDAQGIDGNISVDVTMKVKDDLYYDDVLELKNLTSSYINTENTTVSVPSLSVESFVIPTFSEVTKSTLAEGIPQTVDYSKVGATSYVTDSNNKKYQATVANTGAGDFPMATTSKLPVTNKEFMYHHYVPGHFVDHRSFTVFKQDGESIRGEKDGLIKGVILTGGDVNGDQVIDIMDAEFMKTYWGTNKRSADINFDGTVDMKDFEFIEKNFLLVNQTATNSPKPKNKYKGNTLERIKKELEGM